jgi:5'-nucleotidase
MIILTNDDGIDAPGLRALQAAMAEFGPELAPELAVVAPRDPHSGCGHQVTTDRALTLDPRSAHVYAVDGTPADCTRVALRHLYPEARLVLAGINAGGNLGADVYISGTVAAVREAALNRVLGIAVSQYRNGQREYDWGRAAGWTRAVVRQLLARPVEPGTYWNVNLPHLEPGDADPEVVFCAPCTQPLPVDFRVMGNELVYCSVYRTHLVSFSWLRGALASA